MEVTCIGKKLGKKGYLRLDEDPATQKLENSLSVKTDGQVHPKFIWTSLKFSFGMHFFFYVINFAPNIFLWPESSRSWTGKR